jgi:signal transduction histidine kinase
MEKLQSYLEVVAGETARIQDIALTVAADDKKELVNFVSIAKQRFLINEEAIQEYNRQDIFRSATHAEETLPVSCPLFSLERILDNLLHNATKAIPHDGGSLFMKSYRENNMACLQICNSGEIPADQIEQVRKGQVKGRGLNIIQRFIQTHNGSIDIHVAKGMTIFTIKLPLANRLTA